jgi:TRAP-type C4-dicarboxylate transport system substrate-binding protein
MKLDPGGAIMKFAGIMAIAVVAAGLVSTKAGAADTIHLTMGHVAPPQTTYQQAAVRFADNLKELSGGTIVVDIVPGGALGSPPEMWVQTRTNTLDIHLIDIGAIIMMKEGAPFLVTWAPYLFKDQDQFHRFLDSDLFKEMMDQVEAETGVVYGGFVGDRPPRAVTTRDTPVRTPDDLKGLKIRTPGHPFIIQAFESWGAVPTPLKASEMFLALKSGLVDGQDNGIIDFVGAGYWEVQKQYTPIDYLRSGVGIWFSPQAWANLTDEQRGWVKQAAAKAGEDGKAIYDQQMEEAYGKLDSLGVTLNERDMAAFQAAVSGMVQGLDGKAWPAGLYDKIHNM